MIWHSATLGEILVELETDPEKGLTDAQVQERQKAYGLNFIGALPAVPLRQRLRAALLNPVSITLFCAAALAFGVNLLYQAEHPLQMPLALVLLYAIQLLILALRDAVCVNSIRKLRQRVSPSARVLRNGIERIVNATQLVPGDILLIRKGDLIPADARLLDAQWLTCDESVLSGHFVPVAKSATRVCADIAPMTERGNTVHSGCVVSYGSGKAVVTAIGTQTEIGKLTAVEEAQELSVANRGLKALAASLRKYLPAAFALILVIYCLFLRFTGNGDSLQLLEIGAVAFLYAATLIAALSPDGFSSMATLILTIGVHRMKRRGAIVTNTAALDKLGKVDVVCADKAALTEQNLSVAKCYTQGETYLYEETFGEEVARLLRYAVLCSDDSDDPTDAALIRAYRKGAGISKDEIENLYPRLNGLPFDAERGIMATVNMIDGDSYVIVKGAPEAILEHCLDDNRDELLRVFEGMGQEALHVIAVAVKPLFDPSLAASPTAEDLVRDLSFVGLIGFVNPIRSDAAEAVRFCKSTGTTPIMITGDGLATAVAVAGQIGILTDEAQAITGERLREMDELELRDKIDDYTVFARISPEDKIRLVAALRDKGHVVAITGRNPIDSVALKAADVGLAMGMTGTDAARTAADVVLTDDSFSTIVAIINRSSTMYECIRKGLQFFLCCEFAIGLIALLGLLIWHTPLLTPVQMLAASLLFALLPPLAIGLEPIHKRKASAAKLHVDSFFDGGRRLQVLWQGATVAMVTGVAYAIGNAVSAATAGAMAYTVFVVAASLYSFSLRSRNHVMKLGLLGNPYMIAEILLSIAITLATLGNGTIGLGADLTKQAVWIILLSCLPLIAAETGKQFHKKQEDRT